MSEIIKTSGYSHRFLARLVIEAKTPLSVGSGEKDILTDALVATDVNGLPYIPGTSIAGVVRHMIIEAAPKDFDIKQIFGYQDKNNSGSGSEIIFSEAKILNSEGRVVDGMDLTVNSDSLLRYYSALPIRQHVRINEKGVTDKAGKFDEQVVFAGTRFCFELEMVAKSMDANNSFNTVLEQIQNRTFRVGSGTRCGFGEIEIVELKECKLDLKEPEDLNLYLAKSSNLSADWSGWSSKDVETSKLENWIKYTLILKPEDFFLFGSGYGDDEVDMTPVKEKKVTWKNGKGEMSKEDLILIPATSVKGALSHRVAFHYNKLKGRFAGCSGADKPKVGNENEAVRALFGYEEQESKTQVRGNLIFSDIIENEAKDKILNHVSIDRFTGGAIDGALFSEKATYGKGMQFTLTILAKDEALKDDTIRQAFENALNDICTGMLPLGGGVNRGNGVFTRMKV